MVFHVCFFPVTFLNTGRRSTDDERQISRGLGVMGATGRWRNSLINKCLAAAGNNPSREKLIEVLDNNRISPKIRQLLLHWGYELTIEDLSKKK